VLLHRKVDKLINTYVDVLLLARDAHGDGRVHATFQQTTSATGRLISTDPDLQRTPVKDDDGARIRSVFRATPDGSGRPRVIIDADWSQIELRLLAHFSRDPSLVDAFTEGLDVHTRTAARIFGKDAADISKSERNIGKTINFATIYGQGATALAQQLHIDRKSASSYIESYFSAHPGITAFIEAAVQSADEKGYATTIAGRRRIIPELKSNSPMDRSFGERVAVNTPIQGSAADICKLAMLRVARFLDDKHPRARLLLQIHDELVLEAPTEEADDIAAAVKHIMETVVPLCVPLVADVGVGASWGEAK
jgi:DNA polymerase I